VYRFAAPRVPRALAIVAASLPVAFIPFTVGACSYNNLGTMLLASGTFLAMSAMLDDDRPRAMALAGVVHGLACVAYPPLALAVLFFGVLTLFAPSAQSEKSGRVLRRSLAYAGGVSAVGLVVLVLIAPGYHGFREAFAYERMTTAPRTIDKFKGIL